MTEGYAAAINLDSIERQLARCAALDADHPPLEQCARTTTMQNICPCMFCEDNICNALTSYVYSEMQHA
ncbi:MAG TPA: hypothetical protein VFP95_04515 [Gammaproteobacteria bacterium]|nr:hypothetical protein [Gammaproteobacteria bacterium]